jgi:hypothetical protein
MTKTNVNEMFSDHVSQVIDVRRKRVGVERIGSLVLRRGFITAEDDRLRQCVCSVDILS